MKRVWLLAMPIAVVCVSGVSHASVVFQSRPQVVHVTPMAMLILVFAGAAYLIARNALRLRKVSDQEFYAFVIARTILLIGISVIVLAALRQIAGFVLTLLALHVIGWAVAALVRRQYSASQRFKR